MVHLTLAGLSEDGTRLLLLDDAGNEFTLAVDHQLRSVLRGGDTRQIQTRLGQLEIQMDSTLRPRDIQARIRAGESPEAVAEAAQASVDKIMPFALPVLAEREHVATQAQRSSVRRRGGESGARTLGDSVRARFIALRIPVDSVTWDAYRLEDGRWSLTGEFDTSQRSGAAVFTYHVPGNFVVPEDDHARWLVDDLPAAPPTPAPAPAAPVAQQASDPDEAYDVEAQPEPTRPLRTRRRLTAVPSDDQELPLGDDALELVAEPEPTPTGEPAPAAPAAEDESSPAPEAEPAASADTLDLSETAARVRAAGTETPADPQPELEVEAEPAEAEQETPKRRPVKKTRGRASVPSWDEIMFGGGGKD